MRKLIYVFIILKLMFVFPHIDATSYIFSEPGIDHTKYIVDNNEVLINEVINWNYPNQLDLHFYNYTKDSSYYKTLIIDNKDKLFNQALTFKVLEKPYKENTYYQLKEEISLDEYFLGGYHVINPHEQFGIERPFIEYYYQDELKWQINFDSINGQMVDYCVTDRGYLVLFSHQKSEYDLSVALYEISYEGEIIRYKFLEGNKADIPVKMIFTDTHILIIGTTNSTSGDFSRDYTNKIDIFLMSLNYVTFSVYDTIYLGNSGDDEILDAILFNNELYFLVKFVGKGLFKSKYYEDVFYALLRFSIRLDYINIYQFEPNLQPFRLVKQEELLVSPTLKKDNDHIKISFLTFSKHLELLEKVDYLCRENISLYDYYIINNNSSIYLLFRNIDLQNLNNYYYHLIAYNHFSKTINNYVLDIGEWIVDVRFGLESINICVFNNNYFKSIELLLIEYDEKNNQVYVNNHPITKKRLNEINDDIFGKYFEHTKHQGIKTTVFTKELIIIPFQSNISGGNIYDLNTKIYFNGIGFLNDIQIESGYEITKGGRYLLEVIGHEDRKIIEFTVEKLSQDIIYEDKVVELTPNINLETNKNYRVDVSIDGNFEFKEEREYTVFIILCAIILGINVGIFVMRCKFFKKIFKLSIFIFLMNSLYPQLSANTKYLYFEEEVKYQEIILETKNALIISEDNVLNLIIKEQQPIKLVNIKDPKLFELDNHYVLVYLEDNNLNYLVINHDGKIIESDALLPNVLKYQVKINEDIFYIIGGIAQTTKNEKLDAFICKVDFNFNSKNLKIFTGHEDEWFEDIVFNNGNIIAIGYKDQQSGGEFGYGGKESKNNLFVMTLNNELEIVTLKVINTTNKLIHFNIYIGRYYLILEEGIIVLNDELQIIKAVKTPRLINAYLGNDLLVLFSKEGVYNYHLVSLSQEDYYPINNLITVLIGKDSFYLYKNKVQNKELIKLDVVKVNNFYPHFVVGNYCILPQQNVSVKTPFENGKLIEYYSKPHYERLIDGRYDFVLRFVICGDKEIEIKVPVEVSFECNVIDQGIYPIGYRLIFTGYGTLNGQSIYNNHQINQPGKYQLTLINANQEETIIEFVVSENQYLFSENIYHRWDDVVFKDEKVTFKIEMSEDEYQKFKSVVFKNEEPFSLNYRPDNQELLISFISPNDAGLYVYFLEKIVYDDYEVIFNKPYFVNVLKDKPNIVITPREDLSFKISLDDADHTIRFLEIKALTKTKEYVYYYSLSNQTLTLNRPEGADITEVIISIAYDVGDNIVRTEELLHLSLKMSGKKDNIILGELKLTKGSNQVEEFIVKLSNTQSSPISEVRLQNHLYQRQTYNMILIYGVAIGLFVISLIIGIFGKIIFDKRQAK